MTSGAAGLELVSTWDADITGSFTHCVTVLSPVRLSLLESHSKGSSQISLVVLVVLGVWVAGLQLRCAYEERWQCGLPLYEWKRNSSLCTTRVSSGKCR